MSRWLKPVLIFFTAFLLVYVVLLQSTEFRPLSSLPSFSRLNRFDILRRDNAATTNGTENEITLVDHPKAILRKLADAARAECHDFGEEHTDIRVNGERVVFDPDLTATIAPEDGDLNVYLVFHSHIDPGWLETFDEYYENKVERILNNAVNFLAEHPDARFIWSEMSYLHLWFHKTDESMKEKLLNILHNGQLELCGGAWVMTDEATPYFWATIDNIVEGQRFVREELNVSVSNSWSVDPFGHGAITPYLLSLTGVDNLVVGRLDKHVKDTLIRRGSLLFSWAQPWNTGTEDRLPLVSSLPRTFYTTVDACGPNSAVCCRFDFGNTRSFCGQRANATPRNVKGLAEELTDQYRQMQPYYRTNHLLIAIGDDFFFGSDNDFEDNYRNYKAIAEHVNSNPDYKMKIKFATLADYFDALHSENVRLPVLRGDFFPYTENREGPHAWWTGYFVHRPDFKRLERITQGKLRRLDILRVLSGKPDKAEALQTHRRNLALAQHHDSITGTSKPPVMADYKQRLIEAGHQFRQLEADVWGELDYVDFYNEGERLHFNSTITGHTLTVFNPRTTSEPQRISVFVNTKNVVVVDESGALIAAEVFPYMNLTAWTPLQNAFELVFYLPVPALGTTKVSVQVGNKAGSTVVVDQMETTPNTTMVSEEERDGPAGPANDEDFLIEFESFSFRFNEYGGIKSFKRGDNSEELKLRMNYAYYSDNGGAYVFAPSDRQKSAVLKPATAEPLFFIGPQTVRVFSKLQFENPTNYVLYQFLEIPRAQMDASVEIRVELISSPIPLDGHTFSLTLESGIENDDAFYTDVNGLYLTKRFANDNISLAGNFYPAASSSLIEDHAERLSVLFGQSTAVSTSRRGNLEFFVDRNVKGSDGKGLDYGDSSTNETTHLHYRVLIEKRDVAHAHQTLYLSRHAHESLEQLLHPSSIHETRNARELKPVEWPCDVQLINLRHLSAKSEDILLTIRRLEFDCTILDKDCRRTSSFHKTLSALFPGKRMFFTSLTGNEDEMTPIDESALNKRLLPFQILTIKYV
ncbi:Alpha-mannosidase [Aphelenchoides fujianensis]|nr:Alpha-mannosidase [Aphelenchoides fujianensis]